jgi:FtsP/CotA-like multicopper oxidase with cupredoxin domain
MFGQVTDKKRPATGITRRRFVQGLMAAGVVAGFDLWRLPASAQKNLASPTILRGDRFDLVIGETPVNFTGRTSVATTINCSVPGPTLRWREGDTVTIAVANRLKDQTSIHWHGVRTPSDMDGVPGLSFPGIAPGETFVYRFPVRQRGTYWYHSHSGYQEQTGQYGALIIDPNGEDPIKYDREYVVMLSDWTDENPETILSNLKQQSDYYNYHQRTAGTFFSDIRKNGWSATISDRLMWGRMNMSPTDLSDVSGATYTYLVNGRPPAANWTGLFRPGERVRLRFINASSMTIFDVRIPNLPMTVVQTDGNDVEPVTVDEFRISVAETYDVIVQPKDASAFTIFAQSLDRTGYARATLAPRSGMTAPIPPLDPRPLLTMVDMGMGNMAGMEMGTAGVVAPTRPTGMITGSMPGMNLQPASPTPSTTPTMNMDEMQGMKMNSIGDNSAEDMSRMPGMKMEGKLPTKPAAAAATAANVGGYRGMPFPQLGPDTKGLRVTAAAGNSTPPQPIALREGPQVDNVATAPTERLAEPGNGLNGNGRRVLTYADLRARYRGVDPRPPDREIELHLTGNMKRFVWGFNGKKFSEAEPIRLRLGERVRFILVNDSMMEHPIHLHGLWSELENGNGELRPYKHTINVKPGQRLSYLVSADTPGRWAFHCHLAYHMEAGMFREVVVS